MFNKKIKHLKGLLVSANESANFFAESCHELQESLEIATEEKNFYREMMEQFEEQTDDRFYFRMKKADYNKLINERVILYNENQELMEEIKRLKKRNVEFHTINLDTSAIDIHELTKKIIENINKGRY